MLLLSHHRSSDGPRPGIDALLVGDALRSLLARECADAERGRMNAARATEIAMERAQRARGLVERIAGTMKAAQK